jgi:hypothetical protein
LTEALDRNKWRDLGVDVWLRKKLQAGNKQAYNYQLKSADERKAHSAKTEIDSLLCSMPTELRLSLPQSEWIKKGHLYERFSEVQRKCAVSITPSFTSSGGTVKIIANTNGTSTQQAEAKESVLTLLKKIRYAKHDMPSNDTNLFKSAMKDELEARFRVIISWQHKNTGSRSYNKAYSTKGKGKGKSKGGKGKGKGKGGGGGGGRSGRLFVGNLNFGTTKTVLWEEFGKFGTISDVHLPTDSETGQVRGFAFVTFSDPMAAEMALVQMDGAVVGGRQIRVNMADSKGGGGDRSYKGGGGDRGYVGGGGGGKGGGGGGKDQRTQVQTLLAQHAEGVPGSKLPKLFHEQFGADIEYRHLGFDKLTDYMALVEGVQVLPNPAGEGPNIFKLIGGRTADTRMATVTCVIAMKLLLILFYCRNVDGM